MKSYKLYIPCLFLFYLIQALNIKSCFFESLHNIFSSSRHDQAAKDILDTEEFCEKHQDTPSNPDYPQEVRVYLKERDVRELDLNSHKY